MTTRIWRYKLIFKKGLPDGSKGRNLIQEIWKQLGSYFNLELTSGRSDVTIIYTHDPLSKWRPEGGPGLVKLRGPFSINSEIIMHETFHALGYMKHLGGQNTVRGAPAGEPFLRIDDFITLGKRFGARDWDDERTVYKWSEQTVGGKFFAYRETFNGGQQTSKTECALYEPFLYDFLWHSKNVNILDFQNFKSALKIDLRPSEVNANGRVIPSRYFGTAIVSSRKCLGLNIINAPGVKLDEAWAGSGDDWLTGNQLANKLFGNAGDDTLCGLAGDDTLDGGENTNTADYSRDDGEGGRQGIIVNLSTKNIFRGKPILAGTALDGFGCTDVLISIQNIIGTAYADYIIGSDANNVLAGGGGNDTIDGGAGIDTVDFSTGEKAGETSGVWVSLLGRIAWRGSNETVQLDSIENVIGTKTDDFIVGDGGTNVLEGRGGADSLNGAGGADIMIGGAGGDTYWVDDIGDQIIESVSADFDSVIASVNYTLADNVEQLMVDPTATAGLSLTGNALSNFIAGSQFDDTLNGSLGNDSLNGGQGNDLMIGGVGDDVYWVDGAGDTVVENLANGSDTVYTSVDYTLTDNVETLIADQSVTRGLSLTGNAFNNAITGSKFDDVLSGGGGVDGLDGGAGNDTLIGGTQIDFFRYGMNYGADVIRDFTVAGQSADYLYVKKDLVADFATLITKARQTGSDVVFDFGQGNTLKLENVNLAQFSGRSNCVVFD